MGRHRQRDAIRLLTVTGVAVLCLTPGCSSFGLLGNATVVRPQTFELAASTGFSAEPAPGAGPPPVSIGVQARYGLTDDIDIGFRAFTAGLAGEGRWEL